MKAEVEKAGAEVLPMTGEKLQALIPAVRTQVTAGGLRLARLLDDALLRGLAPGQKKPAS